MGTVFLACSQRSYLLGHGKDCTSGARDLSAQRALYKEEETKSVLGVDTANLLRLFDFSRLGLFFVIEFMSILGPSYTYHL